MSFLGNTSNTPTTSGGGLFGSNNTNNASNTGTAATGGGLFGTQGNPGLFGNPSTTTAGTGLFGGGGGASTTPSTGTTGGLFGAAPNPVSTGTTGGGLFGAATNPTSTGTTGGGLFGAATNPTRTTGGGLFGATTNPTSTGTTGGGLFGAPSTTSSATGTASGLFGTAPSGSAGNDARPPAAPNTNSLFGGFAPKPQGTSTAQGPATSLFGAPSTSTGAPTGGLFGTKPADSTTTGATNTSATPALGGGLFGARPAAPAAATSSGFSLGGNTAATTAPTFSLGGNNSSTTSTSALGGGLFGTKLPEKKDGAAAPAVSFNLGGAKTEDSKAAENKPPAALSANPMVAVPPPSMLRGKTIEEIVNRWTSELETHVKDFTKFAGEVSVWDRALVENSNHLAALYSHVLAAERQQSEIDSTLDNIEQQQRELMTTLEDYERASQEILGGQGGSLRSLDTGPADTERDKNYMLATDLHTNLDDLSASLTQMIESVNALSMSQKPAIEGGEDPMAQISQVLSSHLESLQWIDSSVRELDTKVNEVERRVKESGHSFGNGKSRGFGLNR
ncbi:hypothetical protein EST38_g1227 [Candolleomyces aberdarensis]|uniref:Nucleoporin NSP1 n=1 Tax=Candolleomyces aberdarensis TaxID=2316362 RepID=A0A4Q2DWH0_9AGAR|nr:hypothetical protein EST38_g1227 [Candolleomyces aberdarensis]